MSERRTEPDALPAWPVGLLFVGYPVWWALGFAWLAVVGTAVVMAVLLIQHGRVELPRGFAIWAVFLVFSTAAAIEVNDVLRLVGFAVRAANYIGATVVLLYAYNARSRLTVEKVLASIAWFFATVAVGGWLGVLFPHGSLSTIGEKILPSVIRNNSYVSVLVHPPFAEFQQPYGSPIAFARPSAPFPYTNSWGCNMALLLPLLVAGIVLAGRGRRRVLYLALIALAVVPAAETLNRGMFLAIGVALIYVAVLYGLRGRVGALISVLTIGVTGYAVALATGVAASLDARLQYSQSNAGRQEIYHESWVGALHSPIFGNGAPRPSDVLDISVGTQGQVWNVMFSFGFPALICFVGFFVYLAATTVLVPGRTGPWINVTLAVTVLTSFYYGYDGPQLSVAMLAAALALRATAVRSGAGQATDVVATDQPAVPPPRCDELVDGLAEPAHGGGNVAGVVVHG